MSNHPFAIVPCPTCKAPAGTICPDSRTSVGVHRTRYVRAMAVHRHDREARWAVTAAARVLRNANARRSDLMAVTA